MSTNVELPDRWQDPDPLDMTWEHERDEEDEVFGWAKWNQTKTDHSASENSEYCPESPEASPSD